MHAARDEHRTHMSPPAAQRPASAWRKPLLVIHVAASAGLIGAVLVLAALGVAGLRGADPRTVYPAAHLVDAWVVAPLAVLALATGVLQAVLGGWGLATHWWVTIKLAVTAATAAVVIVVLEPRLAASAEAAIAGQSFTTADFLPLATAPAAALTLLIANVALGISKPRWRRRSCATKEAP